MSFNLPNSFTEKYEIRHLEKEKYAGFILQMDYTSDFYYDVIPETKDKEIWNVTFLRKKAEKKIVRTSAEYNYPDKLYQQWYPNAFAWGIFEKDNSGGNPIAVIEVDAEIWSNRLRITEMWVHKDYRRQGFGSILIELAKEHARISKNRAIMLETQSCNVGAIDFYRSCGFSLIGFDSICYKNTDIDRKEVRLEMGYIRQKKSIELNKIKIQKELESQQKESEILCKMCF